MSTRSPRLSVVIPTRERPRTLPFTLQTCLAQEFDDCEIVVSDNWSSPRTREVVEAFPDRRLRYVRTPSLMAMSDSWEFALEQSTGDYVMLIGDDDGLLSHALVEIDRLLRMLNAKILRWDSVCYNWPDLPEQPYASAHALLIPLGQVESFFPIRRLDARRMIRAAGNSEISYAQLPSVYCSAVHREVFEALRRRTGRVFRGAIPDVYAAFVVAHLAGAYHSIAAPMNINALSSRSTGVATFLLKGRSPIAEEFRDLNERAGYRTRSTIPDLPVMAAVVAGAFEDAKAALFARDRYMSLDRRRLSRQCLEAIQAGGETGRREAIAAIRLSLTDDRALVGWFDEEVTRRAAVHFPERTRPTALKTYGGTYLHLDASQFGVSDVMGVARLCESLLGLKRDGVNAHYVPGGSIRPGIPPSRWAIKSHHAMSRIRSVAGRAVKAGRRLEFWKSRPT